jgi:membrane protein
MVKRLSKLQKLRANAQELLDEQGLRAAAESPKWRRFLHFWVLVWASFSRNRCPVRASALAYGTLLALIPMLAVVVSITSSFLKQEGEERIDQFIVKLVASVTPPATVSTNLLAGATNATASATNAAAGSPMPSSTNAAPATGAGLFSSKEDTDSAALSAFAKDQKAIAARKAVARNIHQFVQNTRSSALGVTGSVLLIFAAISMLSRIESTFNDIWGVARGRGWFMRIVLYWGVLSLAPILLIVALGLATGPHFEGTKRLVAALPYIGGFVFRFGFQLLPIVMLCLAFGAFYMLMPNAKVNWRAALVGGLVGGLLFHLNNIVSVLYVSRVVSNSKIYGSLGLVPVFMIGLYFSWLILLFGAQVAYAFQNRASYVEEKQVEAVNQHGREFIALRLMTLLGQYFVRGEPPPNVAEMAEDLGVPTRLLRQVLQPLSAARLVVEVTGPESGFLPARPLESITCHDILLALRASQGQELATRDEPTRLEVYDQFHRILEAERQAAASVSLLALVNRAQAQLRPEAVKAIVGPAGD